MKKESKRKLERVKVRIVQPRIAHFFSEVWYTREELDAWEKTLTEGAEKAIRQAGGLEPRTFKTGGWCFWCKGRPVCPEQERKRFEQAAEMFSDVEVVA